MKDYKILIEHIKTCLNETIKTANNTDTAKIKDQDFLNGGKKLAEMLLSEIKSWEKINA